MSQPDTRETHLALRPPTQDLALPDAPEAFGRGLPTPPGYEAFGRAEEPPRPPSNGHHRDEGDPARMPTSREQGLRTPYGHPSQRWRSPDYKARAAPEPPRRAGADAPVDEPDIREERGRENPPHVPADQGNGGGPQPDAPPATNRPPAPARRPLYKRPAVLITAGMILLLLIISGVLFWLWYRQYEWTDDAYIDGHVTQISPQVAAPILRLHVDDNQLVNQGDLLAELDPTDYQVALEQAQAQAAAAQGRLRQDQAQVEAAQAAVKEAAAQVDAAQVASDNAVRDYQRYASVDERARSQQQLDNATAAKKNAEALLAQARARQTSAQANVTTAQAAVQAGEGDLKEAQANVDRARVNLGYCRICAPSQGRVTERNVEDGTYVSPGQPMFALVSPEVWVTANYKETQLTNMKPGQNVAISVDAYPGKKYAGHVDSIQAGAGARFSVLPPENATGNFVKIVQRVPVKIVFDQGPNLDDYRLLAPGLSVVPRVRVR